MIVINEIDYNMNVSILKQLSSVEFMEQLEYLNLAKNDIESIEYLNLLHMPKLRKLILCKSDLTTESNNITNIQSLRKLYQPRLEMLSLCKMCINKAKNKLLAFSLIEWQSKLGIKSGLNLKQSTIELIKIINNLDGHLISQESFLFNIQTHARRT